VFYILVSPFLLIESFGPYIFFLASEASAVLPLLSYILCLLALPCTCTLLVPCILSICLLKITIYHILRSVNTETQECPDEIKSLCRRGYGCFINPL
jgi:hypothetical protein